MWSVLSLKWETARSTSRRKCKNGLEEESNFEFNECTEMLISRMMKDVWMQARKKIVVKGGCCDEEISAGKLLLTLGASVGRPLLRLSE